MSLLLDALQRSEQRPLTLALTEDPLTAPVQPDTSPAAQPGGAPPVVAAQTPAAASAAGASARPAAPGTARQAAQAMVGANTPSPAPAPQVRVRRLIFSLLLGLGLAVVSWFGWQYWQSSQRSLLAVAPPAAQPAGGDAVVPVAVDPATPADGAAATDPATAAAAAGGNAPDAAAAAVVGAAPQPGAQPSGEVAPGAAQPVTPTAQAALPAPKPLGTAQAAGEKGVQPEPSTPRTAPEPAPARSAAAAATAQAPAPAAEALTGESPPPSAAAPTAPPGGGASASGRVGKPPATARQDAMLVRSEAQRRLQDAWTALGQNDAVRAQALYQQVLAERPDDPDATLGLAVALHRQHKLEPAWAAYQRSLHLWPDNETARTGLLAILSESDPVTAESRLQEWVQTRPRDAAAQSALGNLLGRQGRWADALGPLMQAQSLAPERAAHAYNLAVALDQARRYEDALRMYRQALQIGGTGIPVKAIEYRLQDLQEQLSR